MRKTFYWSLEEVGYIILFPHRKKNTFYSAVASECRKTRKQTHYLTITLLSQSQTLVKLNENQRDFLITFDTYFMLY